MTQFDRRSFLQWLIAAGVLSSASGSSTGCAEGDSSANPAPLAPRAVQLRTLHFDLSHTNALASHTLVVGARRYSLSPHTDTTRAAHRGINSALSAIPDERLTHVAVDVPFPADAAQSYRVEHQHPDTSRRPYLSVMGIHLPSSARSSAGSTLTSAKLRALGLSPQDAPPTEGQDLGDFVDMTDAALCIACHHPELVSLDPVVLATVLQHIANTQAFHSLVASLGTQGRAQSLEGWDVEGKEGFANGQVVNNLDGKPVPDGKGGYRWIYVYTDETNNALRPVLQQALTAVRNDKTLEGSRYTTVTGIHAIDGSQGPQTRGTAKACSALTVNTPYKYKLSDEDWQSGRKIEIESVVDRTIKVVVHHSYFRHMGVFVRFADVDGNHVALSSIAAGDATASSSMDRTYARFLGVVDPRLRLLGIPLEGETSEDYTFTIPSNATSAEILCASLGIGSLPNSHAKYEDVEVIGSVLTGVFELALPAFFLAWGVGVEKMESSGKKVLAELAIWLVENFIGGAAVRGVFVAAGTPSGAVFSSWAMDIVMSLITTTPGVIVGLLEWAAEESAEESLEHSLPVIGQVLFAAEVIGTLAEITETVVDIFCSPWVVPATLSLSMDINVTVAHDTKDYQFPGTAVRYKLIATFSNSTSRVIERTLDNTKVATITEVFKDVPTGGVVEISATFYAPNGWVAGYGTTGRVANLVPGSQTSLSLNLTITENKIALSPQTHYYHRQLLTVQNGAHQWLNTAVPSTQTVAALVCTSAGSALCAPSGITLNMNGRLGYHWQAASAGLNICGSKTGATQLYTMQGIGLDTANPDDALRVLQCGFTRPAHLVYSLMGPLDGAHFAVAPTLDPSTGGEVYHARKISLVGKTPLDLTALPSWGKFSFDRIAKVILHPQGYLIALHADLEKLELLRIPDAPYASDDVADYAKQIGGQGNNIGLMDGAVALAPAHDGGSFLVLEGTNQRIQAFNTNGVVVPYFAQGATSALLGTLPQDSGLQITYVDLALESQGYIYVLSYEGAGSTATQYRLDIYQPDGTFQSRTRGVAAARLVVDVWRVVYTLNYQLLQGPNARPEPSVSEWLPTASN